MKSTSLLTIFLTAMLFSSPLASTAFADVISPRQQMKLDFTAEQVICSEGLVKIIKSSSGKVSCVKPLTAEKLAENGWAEKLSVEKIEEINNKQLKKGEPVGTITKIATVKQLSVKSTTGVSTSISGYVYVFEACSTGKTIRAPEIYVTSDSDTKSVKLGSKLNPNSCYTSSVLIKAADPNSISATMLNKGGISEKISTLETQIEDLKSKIIAAKQKLPKSNEVQPNSENLNNIISMKKDLKSLQDQLRRYLMVLYVPPNVKISKIDLLKSIIGKPMVGFSANLISVTESVAKPDSSNADLKRFNVIFEACSGKNTIRLPIISVTSDSDSTDVKLVERIIPESCQVGMTRINAMDSESVVTTISGNSGVSLQINSLEIQIGEMEVALADKRSQLHDIASKKLDAKTESMTVKIAEDISKIRSDLLESKMKLNALLLKAQ